MPSRLQEPSAWRSQGLGLALVHLTVHLLESDTPARRSGDGCGQSRARMQAAAGMATAWCWGASVALTEPGE